MQHLDLDRIEKTSARRVWSVRDFARRQNLNEMEEAPLLQLFRPFATASELQQNAKRPPKIK